MGSGKGMALTTSGGAAATAGGGLGAGGGSICAGAIGETGAESFLISPSRWSRSAISRVSGAVPSRVGIGRVDPATAGLALAATVSRSDWKAALRGLVTDVSFWVVRM